MNQAALARVLAVIIPLLSCYNGNGSQQKWEDESSVPGARWLPASTGTFTIGIHAVVEGEPNNWVFDAKYPPVTSGILVLNCGHKRLVLSGLSGTYESNSSLLIIFKSRRIEALPAVTQNPTSPPLTSLLKAASQ